MVRYVIGLITAIPTATGVSIFDAAIKLSLSILLNITYYYLTAGAGNAE